MNQKPELCFPVRVATVLIAIICLCMLVFSGCGKYREELEQAKREIEQVTSVNRQLTETANRLERDKSALIEQVQGLSDTNESLIKDLNNLKLAHSQLLKQKEELEDKSKEMRQQVESLKEANRDLQSQVERLGERLAPPTATGGIKEENSTAKQSPVKPDTVQPENRTGSDPCDALVEYMHKVESILRYAPKQERSQRLEQLEQEYRDRMEALPKAARTDVQAYVSEFVREWDSPGDDTVYNLIKKRDDALKACGKEPTKAGF